MIEKRSNLWSTIRRAAIVNGRMLVVNGRIAVGKSLCLGMGSGLVGGKWVIGLDLAWSDWFDRQWEPTKGECSRTLSLFEIVPVLQLDREIDNVLEKRRTYCKRTDCRIMNGIPMLRSY